MTKNNDLLKYLDAQNQLYLKALGEIKNGQKLSHWMWFIFPQISGLGKSEMARRYALKDLDEAQAYLQHPVLGKHLMEITTELLNLERRTATQIMGTPDDLKLHSSMTLFSQLKETDHIFQRVIDKFYSGVPDARTLNIINQQLLRI